MLHKSIITNYYYPSIYGSSNNPAVGQVQFVNNQLCVYDGNYWTPLPQPIQSVELSYDAESAIEWAFKKMQEEKEIINLAASNQAVRNALLNVNNAKEHLDVIVALSKDTNEVTS